jgi:hypothetical protein
MKTIIAVHNIRNGLESYNSFKRNGYKFDTEWGWMVYAGRGCESPLGNPYRIEKDGDRTQVIQKFRKKLWNDLQLAELGTVTPLASEVKELAVLAQTSNVHLFCWCAPEPCHCDVIKSCIEWMNDIDF